MDYEKFEKTIKDIVKDYYGNSYDDRQNELIDFLIECGYAESIASIAKDCGIV